LGPVVKPARAPPRATLTDVGNVGPLEVVVVLIIALVVFGPKRAPELGKSLGKGIREFRASLAGESDEDEEPESLEPPQLPRSSGSTTPASDAEPAEETAPTQSRS
jgi:sec-independent protein translocase protein TatA